MATTNHLPESLTCQTVSCDAAATLARVASARLAARAGRWRVSGDFVALLVLVVVLWVLLGGIDEQAV